MLNLNDLRDVETNAVNNVQGIDNPVVAGLTAEQINAEVESKVQKESAKDEILNNTNPLILQANNINKEESDVSFLDSVGDAITSGIPAVAASAVLSVVNTGVELGNAFGGDFNKIDEAQMFNEMGMYDTAKYYEAHKEVIDVAGFITGSIIPGMAGVKALRAFQSADMILNSTATISGFRVISGFGKLSKTSDAVRQGVKAIATGSQKEIGAKLITSTLAKGVTQNSIEGIAAGLTALATMNQSPFLNKDNLGYFDAVSANFGTTITDGFIGGVVFGGIGGLWNIGKFKRAANEALKVKSKVSAEAVTDFNNQLTGGDKIVSLADQYNNHQITIKDLEKQAAEGIITETDKNITLPQLKSNALKLHANILKQVKQVTKDEDLAEAIQKRLMTSDKSTITMPIEMANLLRFSKVSKVNEDSGIYNNFGHVTNKARNNVSNSFLLNNLIFAKVSQEFKFAPALVAEFETALKIDTPLTVKELAEKVGTYSERDLNKLYEELQSASISYRSSYWDGIVDWEDRLKTLVNATTPNEARSAKAAMRNIVKAYSPQTFIPDSHAAFDKDLVNPTKNPLLYKYLNDTSLGNSIEDPSIIIDLFTNTARAGNTLPTASDIGVVELGKVSKDLAYKIKYGNRSVDSGAGKYSLDGIEKVADKDMNWYSIDKNAEFVAAKQLKNFPAEIGATDFPFLDAAFAANKKVKIKDVGELEGAELGEYIRATKAEELRKIQDGMIGKPKVWTTDQLSKILNTDENFIAYNGVNSVQVPLLKFTLSDMPIELPRYAKAIYKPLKDGEEEIYSGLSDIAIVQLKQQAIDANNKLISKQVGGLFSTSLTNLFNQMGTLGEITTLTEKAGQKLFAFSNGDYQTVESHAQFIGSIVERVKQEVNHTLRSTYNAVEAQVNASVSAKAEIGLVINRARSANYTKLLNADTLTELEKNLQRVNTPASLAASTKVGNILTTIKGTKGDLSVYIREETNEAINASSDLFTSLAINPPKNVDAAIDSAVNYINNLSGNYQDAFRITNHEVESFLNVHQEINTKYIAARKLLTNAEGRTLAWNPDRLYFHPPKVNPAFMAFVKSPENPITGERIKSVLIGKDANDLAAKVRFVEQNYPEYGITTPSQQKEFAEDLVNYQGDAFGYNKEFDVELQSKGVMNSFMPRTDGKDMADEISSMVTSHMQLLNKTVMTHYSDSLAPLKAIEKALDEELGITLQSGKKYFTDNPARKIKNLMIAEQGEVSPLWDKINHTLQTTVDRSISFLDDLTPRGTQFTQQNIDEINKLMEDLGYKHAYSTAAEHILANTSVPKNYIRQFIGTVNSIISMSMMRLETMASIVDSVGTVTLMSPEIRSIINTIPRDKLAALFSVKNGSKVPEFSVSRLMAKNLNKVMSQPNKEMVDKYRDMGILIKQNEYYEAFHNTLLIEEGMTVTKIQQKIKQLGDLGSKYSGSNHIRNFSRLWIANIAEDLGKAAGITSDFEMGAFINTFLNRVQGNITASQRPKIFQGVIGQAVGLFQSYMFNLMQQATRHMTNGNSKGTLEMLAINSTLFGMQSLPAWAPLNNMVAQQNREGFGLDTSIYSVAGEDIGNWLMYGTLSNVTQLGVFSRGQIGLGLIDPTTGVMEKIPAVSMMKRTLDSIGTTLTNLGNGGKPIDALLEGLSLNGLNRPIAELAQLTLGYQPTRRGDVIDYTNVNFDNFQSWWAIFGAMLGSKNLDSAIIRQQYYTQYSREAALNSKLNPLMEEVKNDLRSGELTQERLTSIMKSYAAAGGDLKKFQKWLVNAMVNSKASQSRKMANMISNSENRFNQALMRGADDNLFGADTQAE